MLINCEECRETISDEASICPHCGIRRITKSERNKQESERINQIKIIEQQKKEKIQKIIFAMNVCCGGGVVCVGKNKKCRCDKSKH